MSCYGLGLLTPNRFVLDLLNEILNIDFGQRAAKVSKFKFGGRKKISTSSTGLGRVGVEPG